MPVPASDAPQWIVNLSVVLAALATAIGGVIVSRREKKTDRPEASASVAVLGGALADPRAIERLCDQLGHSERATRDGERATIDNTHEVKRLTESLGDVRQMIEANWARRDSDEAMILKAIEKTRGKTTS